MNRGLLALTLAAAASIAGLTAAREPQSRTVYLSVLDSNGVPLPGLRASDLAVTEDGHAREIVRVEPATQPMQLAVVLDDWGLGRPEVRQALANFVAAMNPNADIGMFDAGRPDWNHPIIDFTHDLHALISAIQTYVPLRGMYQSSLDNVLDDLVRHRLSREGTTRPVVVVLSSAGIFANSEEEQEQIWQSRTTFFAIAGRVNGMSTCVDVSGGRLEQTLTTFKIPDLMKRISADILGQYALTYASEAPTKEGFRLRVKTTKHGASVQAPQRVY